MKKLPKTDVQRTAKRRAKQKKMGAPRRREYIATEEQHKKLRIYLGRLIKKDEIE